MSEETSLPPDAAVFMAFTATVAPAVASMFMGGVLPGILLGLGILGSYIGAIYQEVKARPRYIVRLDTDKMLKRDQDK